GRPGPRPRPDRLGGRRVRATMSVVTAAAADTAFEGLLEYLRDKRGFDYTGYKRPTLSRRFEKRMEAVGVDSFDAYRDYLERDGDGREFAELFNTILINVTGFFRDAEAWTYVEQEVRSEEHTSELQSLAYL